MTTFLLSLLPVSLGIWCIHILFQPDHLLDEQGQWITNKLGKKWSKPVINCPICQSSLWGIVGFFAVQWLFEVTLHIKLLIPFVFCLCGLNTIISKLTSKERIIVDE